MSMRKAEVQNVTNDFQVISGERLPESIEDGKEVMANITGKWIPYSATIKKQQEAAAAKAAAGSKSSRILAAAAKKKSGSS